MKFQSPLRFFLLLVAFLNSSAWATLPANYYEIPRKTLKSQSQSLDSLTSLESAPALRGLSPEQVLEAKKSFRAKINVQKNSRPQARFSPFSALPQEALRLSDFLELAPSDIESNLARLESRGLNQAQLPVEPWSDTYWPMYKGLASQRYADPLFEEQGQGKFKNYYEYVNKPAHRFPDFVSNIHSANDPRLLNLSPAEKYDLLVGDPNATLSRRMWNESKNYMDENGNVESWMGICHGWAPASYRDDRPLHKVEVLAFDQKTPLTFYPSDIKGLTTLLWANARSPMLAIGNRCNEKDPPRDNDDRLLNPECEDIHPGLWHLAIVHQIGVKKLSFVMDATWDFEVWNQPVTQYSVNFFQVDDSSKTSDKFMDVIKDIESIQQDPFKKYRSPLTRHIVGVAMSVQYLSENSPSHDDTDSSDNDRSVQVEYVYDLELDENFTIVGGEWHQFAHPDFLWNPPQKSLAWSWADQASRSEWSGTGPIPADLRRMAVDRNTYGNRTTSALGTPIGKVLRKLIQKSRE